MTTTPPTDSIVIKDLLVRGIIGVNDWEREVEQDILVNVTLTADLSRAGQTDDLADTVNYRTVAKKIIAHVESTQRFTLEALAADIAAICLSEPGVRRTRVRVEKPGALRFARSVGVEIEREAGSAG
ncbi:MAG: dihydroneopterin aldolase [Anaerolineales bacterium]